MPKPVDIKTITDIELLALLSEAAKKPLDDMDKYQCWPSGQERAYDHTPYYWLRILIGEADKRCQSLTQTRG